MKHLLYSRVAHGIKYRDSWKKIKFTRYERKNFSKIPIEKPLLSNLNSFTEKKKKEKKEGVGYLAPNDIDANDIEQVRQQASSTSRNE